MASKIFAALEVGSAVLSLKVYEISKKDGFRELDHVRYGLNIGSDVYTDGLVSLEKADEMCTVLNRMKNKLAEYRVGHYRVVGGSALREASNRDMILDQIRIRTGLTVQIMSNAEQRFLTLKSVAYKMNNFENLIREGAAIVDMGAGSLQVSVFEEGTLSVSTNIRLGSLRIREILSDMEGRTTSFVRVMEDYISNDLNTLHRLGLDIIARIRHMIVVGEEFSSIVNYVSMQKDKDSLSAEQFKKVYKRILEASPDEIAMKYHIPFDLASVIVPSTIIYQKLLENSSVERLWEPGADLCDGLAVEYAQQSERYVLAHDFERDILSNAWHITGRYDCDTGHIMLVEKMCEGVFDGVRRISGLGDRDRLLLRLAAILHDCGKFVSLAEPNKAAFSLIQMSEIIGLSQAEKEIVAYTVLYGGKDACPPYVAGDAPGLREDYMRALKLGAILRVCNSMDRSHKQKITGVRVTIKGDVVRIVADTVYDLTLEIGTVAQRRNLFMQTFGYEPVLRAKHR